MKLHVSACVVLHKYAAPCCAHGEHEQQQVPPITGLTRDHRLSSMQISSINSLCPVTASQGLLCMVADSAAATAVPASPVIS
jgi:hypothetical protein